MVDFDQIEKDKSRDEYIKNYLDWHIRNAIDSKVYKTIDQERIFCGCNLCLSSDASKYAILSENNNISFMGTQLNIEYYPMLSIQQPVSSIIVSDDFTFIAVYIDGNFLKIFHIPTQKFIQIFDVKIFEKFEFSKDNQFILVYKKGEAKIFDINQGYEIWSTSIQFKRACFCPNNYITLIFDKQVMIGNIFDRSIVFQLQTSEFDNNSTKKASSINKLSIENAKVSNKGDLLYIQLNNDTFVLYSINSRTIKFQGFTYSKGTVIESIKFSTNDERLAFNCDRRVHVWRLDENFSSINFSINYEQISNFSFVNDTYEILILTNKMQTIKYDINTYKYTKLQNEPSTFPTMRELNSKVKAFSSDQSLMAIADSENTSLSLYSLGTRKLIKQFLDLSIFNKIAFSSKYLAVGHQNGRITILSLQTWAKEMELPSQNGSVITALEFSKEKYLAIGNAQGEIFVFNFQTKNMEKLKENNNIEETENDYIVTALKFSDDEGVLSSGGSMGSILIWNMTNLQLADTIPAEHEAIEYLQFNTDHKILLSVCKSFLTIWHSQDGFDFELFKQRPFPFSIIYCGFDYSKNSFLLFEKYKGRIVHIDCKTGLKVSKRTNLNEVFLVGADKSNIKAHSINSMVAFKQDEEMITSIDVENPLDISPDGKRVLYLKGEQLLIHEIESGKSRLAYQKKLPEFKNAFFLNSQEEQIILQPSSNSSTFSLLSPVETIFQTEARLSLSGLVASDDSKLLLAFGNLNGQGKGLVYDLDSKSKIATYSLEGSITSGAISRSGTVALSNDKNLGVYIFGERGEFEEEERTRFIIKAAAEDSINQMKFNSTSDFLYIWSNDGYLGILDCKKMEKIFVFNSEMEDSKKDNFSLSQRDQLVFLGKTGQTVYLHNYSASKSKFKILDDLSGFQHIYIRQNNLFLTKENNVTIYQDFQKNSYIMDAALFRVTNSLKMLKKGNFQKEEFKHLFGPNKTSVYPFNLSFLHVLSYTNEYTLFETLTEILDAKHLTIDYQEFFEKDIFGRSPFDIVFNQNKREMLTFFLNYLSEKYSPKNGFTFKKEDLKIFNYRFFNRIFDIYGSDTRFLNKVLDFLLFPNPKVPEILIRGFPSDFSIQKNLNDIYSDMVAKEMVKENRKSIFFEEIDLDKEKIEITCLVENDFFKTSLESERFFQNITKLQPSNEIFANPTLSKILKIKWEDYGRTEFFVEALLFFSFLLVYLFNSAYLFPLRQKNPTSNPFEDQESGVELNYHKLSFICNIIIALFLLSHIKSEFYQIKGLGPRFYFRSIWNCVDTILIIFFIPCIILDMLNIFSLFTNLKILKVLHSITIFLFFLRITSFTRGVDNAAFMIRLFLRCIWDIRFFVVILIALTLGYSFSAYINQLDFGEVTKFDMFTICFRRILGDLDYWNQVNERISWLKLTNFLFATVTIFVVFLNMMVGILNGTYNDVSDNEKKTRKFERANILFESHEFKKDKVEEVEEEDSNDTNVKCRFFFRKVEREEDEEGDSSQKKLREIVESTKERMENLVNEMNMHERDDRKRNVQIKKNLKNLSRFINQVKNGDQQN